FYDTTYSDRSISTWNFTDPNSVDWARASRVAHDVCTSPSRGYQGGQFTGYFGGDRMGLDCYRGTWFDFFKSELALSTSDATYVPWAEAARAADRLCMARGFGLGGKLNGWQSPTNAGAVCYGPRDNSNRWMDIVEPQLSQTGNGFTNVNTVSWAQGARAAAVF